ncbi:MAG: glutathione synthase [Pseudomonadota bacterium]
MARSTSSLKLGIVMDPIESITAYKDSSVAMLRAARRRGWDLYYMTPQDLYLRDGVARAQSISFEVSDRDDGWYELGDSLDAELREMDAILMRKDPPFDMDYIYATYLLEMAERAGALVVNAPAALRDANEKLSTAWFPQCCVPTLVSARQDRLRDFVAEHGDVIVKPLDGMGGESIFRLRADDPNINVVLETLTRRNVRQTMAQTFIPAIADGDKRILLIDGEPIPYALARIPAKGETRGNLAAGGTGVAVPLTDRDRWICEQVAPVLRERRLLFVGIDVIGDFLTEVNVTSPTCIRELDAAHDMDIGGQLMDAVEKQINSAGK